MKIKLLTTKDLRSKKAPEIVKYIVDLRQSQKELTHLIATNAENKTHQLSQLKRAIAQAKTIESQLKAEEKE